MNKEEEKVTVVISSPKDVFMQIFMIGTLYASVISFISLWFDYLNFLFPDELNYYYQGILDGILWATAALVVIFPIYIFLSHLLEKNMAAEPEKRDLSIRKWLVHLTLFLAAIAIVVDIVRLVYNFLSGELTILFFLKISVVLIVAATVFGYYLWDIRRQADAPTALPKTLARAVSVAVFISIIVGFFLFGSPAHQRGIRLDNQRVNDLQMIQGQVLNYWQQKERLPGKISELEDRMSGFTLPVNMDTEYEYIVKGDLAFDLCATFKTASVEVKSAPDRYSKPFPVAYQGDLFRENWNHGAGHACFSRTIDPELYKINKPIPVLIQ